MSAEAQDNLLQQNDDNNENDTDNDPPAPQLRVTLRRAISLCKSESLLIVLGTAAIIGDVLSTIGENILMGRLIDAFTRESMKITLGTAKKKSNKIVY